MRLYKDCYFVERDIRGKVTAFAKCLHPGVRDDPKPDLVLGGQQEPYAPYAASVRVSGEPCGPDAKLFRPMPGEGKT